MSQIQIATMAQNKGNDATAGIAPEPNSKQKLFLQWRTRSLLEYPHHTRSKMLAAHRSCNFLASENMCKGVRASRRAVTNAQLHDARRSKACEVSMRGCLAHGYGGLISRKISRASSCCTCSARVQRLSLWRPMMRAGAASAPAARIAARLDVEDSVCVLSSERSNHDSDHTFRGRNFRLIFCLPQRLRFYLRKSFLSEALAEACGGGRCGEGVYYTS